jgi:hypothetical protein
LSAFTLSTAMGFGAAALAADLPKEGTFSGTYSATSTYKAYLVGKERVLVTYDENGLTVGKGFYDHMTWHCFGLADIASGIEQAQGRCVGTDPAGDQIALESEGKHAADAKTYGGTATFTTGTGKYAGISGGATFELHGPEFRTATEGTNVQYGEIQAKYKLP